jgi:hypothetical protein
VCQGVNLGAGTADDEGMWAVWVACGLVGWVLAATIVAVVVGRAIAIADRRTPGVGTRPAVSSVERPTRAPALGARRLVPVPPLTLGLCVAALALESTGYVLRLTGARGALATLLSMDAPGSLPRLFVAGAFLAAALAAGAGAGRTHGRRTWWAAVAVVTAGVGSVKAGGTVHATAMAWLTRTVGPAGALAVSVLLAVGTIGGLWWLSRTERRDRRRVLGSLALYGLAAVGLSAVSSVAGPGWATTATFVEEAGEALSAVAVLTSVLIGVAPRLVLPADWALRRRADADTLDAVAPVVLHPTAR